MKNFSKKVLKVTLAFSLVFFLSCSEEEAAKAVGCDITTLTNQSQELGKIYIEYQKNKTPENCKKCKEAIQKFVKGVEACDKALGSSFLGTRAEDYKKIGEGLDCE